MNEKIIKKPTVKIYPCSSCKNFIHWQKTPMYLYHNYNSIYKNYDVQIFCEECYLDSFLSYYGYFNIEFTYIDYTLMALMTQDEEYLKLHKWNYNNNLSNNIDSFYYENRFVDYQSFFIYFLSLYNQNSCEFLIYILKYSSDFFKIPIKKIFSNIFLDYDIKNSNLYNADKFYFLNKIQKQSYNIYNISGLHLILPSDIIQVISEY